MYNYQNEISKNDGWVAKPLGRKGDLNSWVEKMETACPEPELGQVVWLNNNKNSVGYKVLGFKRNGDVIWQRGQVIWH
mgnify:FL=1|jgi:hypothetical protein